MKNFRMLFISIVLLILVGFYWTSTDNRYIVRNNIVRQIEMLIAEEKEPIFKLSNFTKFKWDRVAYFKFPATEVQITAELGAEYTGVTDLMEGFVFAYQEKVVYYEIVGMIPDKFYKLRFEGDDLFRKTNILVLTEDEAIFEAREKDNGRGSFFVINPIPKPNRSD